MHLSIPGPPGPFAIKICKLLLANVHRLVRPYLFGAAVVGWAADSRPYGEGRTWSVTGGPVRTPAPTRKIERFLRRGGCPHPPAISPPPPFVGADMIRPPKTDHLPWPCQSRRCPYNADTSSGSPPKPSEAGLVGRGGARKRHDGCPCLGVRNRADFATTKGPVSPGQEGSDGLVFARRVQFPIFLEGVPRNRGSGASTPMNTGASQVFIEGAPQRFFGDFLIVQKVTSPFRLAGRNPAKTDYSSPLACLKNSASLSSRACSPAKSSMWWVNSWATVAKISSFQVSSSSSESRAAKEP